MSDKTSYTASEARSNLYSLIKKAQTRHIEIRLRGTDPVVLMSKDEVESWEETLDILSHPEEVKAIRQAMKQKRLYSHREVLKAIGMDKE